MILCFATNNAHKLDEVQPLLSDNFELKTLADIGCYEELPETGDTLDVNAAQKAQYVWDHYGVACFADDTGLEVSALGGAPGVYSARYAGPARDAAANTQKLLTELAGQADRSARFRTVVAYIDATGTLHSFEGTVEGEIMEDLRGTGGFGYDPVFRPIGYTETFAELPLAEKNRIGHRGRAVARLAEFLRKTGA
jgi:XTP/dITP diphosphohydrolase